MLTLDLLGVSTLVLFCVLEALDLPSSWVEEVDALVFWAVENSTECSPVRDLGQYSNLSHLTGSMCVRLRRTR